MAKVPTITIQKRGTFSLNAAAAHALAGDVEKADGLPVELLFDRENRRVGLRRAESEHPNVYHMRRQKNSESYLIGGRAFTMYYGIDTTQSRRYTAKKLEDGILAAELEGEHAVVTRE